MQTCDHVTEVVRGKDYTYCSRTDTIRWGTVRLCPAHLAGELEESA